MCLGVSCEVRKNKVKNHSAAKRQFENKTGAKTVLSVVVVVVGQSINKTKSKRSNGRVCWGWMDDVSLFVVNVPTLNNCTPMTANMNCSRHVTRTIFPMVFTATITHWTTCCTR